MVVLYPQFDVLRGFFFDVFSDTQFAALYLNNDKESYQAKSSSEGWWIWIFYLGKKIEQKISKSKLKVAISTINEKKTDSGPLRPAHCLVHDDIPFVKQTILNSESWINSTLWFALRELNTRSNYSKCISHICSFLSCYNAWIKPIKLCLFKIS